jgi:PAS domain S-box-containing protein
MAAPGGNEAQTLFEHLMDAAPVMIWASGPDKGCTWFNQRWLEFTGRSMSQERGDGWADGVHPDDLARCFEIYVSHFDLRVPFTMEYRLRRADGEYRRILDAGVPRFDANRSFQGYIGSCIDIEAVKATPLGAVERMSREQPEVWDVRSVASVAREFEKLVTAFLGDLQAIERSAADPQAVRRRVEEAEDAVLQGKRVITQLLHGIPNHLRPGGAASAEQNVPDTWKVL